MMSNLNLEEDIKGLARNNLQPGFSLYDFVLIPGKSVLKIRILLDKLDDPWGAPTIAECSAFARSYDTKLMEMVNMGKLTADYVLEVSSPGAERELKNLTDWVRFQGKAVKVRYNDVNGKITTEVFKLLGYDGEVTKWEKVTLKKDKKVKKRKSNDEVIILIKNIVLVKLYLDF